MTTIHEIYEYVRIKVLFGSGDFFEPALKVDSLKLKRKFRRRFPVSEAMLEL